MAPGSASITARIIALVCLTFGIAACESKPQPTPTAEAKAEAPAAKAAAKPAVAPAPGGQGGWMDGIPAVVPRFTFGTLKPDSNKITPGENVVYNLYYGGVTFEQAQEYAAKLKAAGFKVQEEKSRPGELSVSGHLPQGAGRIGFSLSRQSSGHVDYTINVIKKYQ